MRIGMILPGQFPPDIRVEKEIGTLSGTHEIAMLCLQRGEQPARENWHGADIYRIFTRSQRWRSQFTLMSFCRSRAWETEIGKFIETVRPDVLHVHDLPVLGPAIAAAKGRHIPIIADFHENYPAMLEHTSKVPWNRISSLGSLVSRLTVSIRRWRAYEVSVLPHTHRIIAVVEEARDRLLSLGAIPDKVHVVGNYASLDDVTAKAQPATPTSDDKGSRLNMVYAGGFGPTRDLITLLNAIKILPAHVRADISIQLIGGKGRDLLQLREHARSIGVDEHVDMRQWMPRAEAERLMSEADVGLVPHVKSAHTDATIPHKLFQYMWRRLPVIVSDCEPLERIVNETGCGLVYRSGDSQSLAKRLAEMHGQSSKLAGAMGDAGHSAVRSKYNWNAAGETLLNLYRNLG